MKRLFIRRVVLTVGTVAVLVLSAGWLPKSFDGTQTAAAAELAQQGDQGQQQSSPDDHSNRFGNGFYTGCGGTHYFYNGWYQYRPLCTGSYHYGPYYYQGPYQFSPTSR